MADNSGKEIHVLSGQQQIGEIRLSEEVIAVIAGMAATEVEGVDSMSGNIRNGLVEKMGMKDLSKGVNIEVEEGQVNVDLSLIIRGDSSIPEVSRLVKEKVTEKIEGMTGLTVKSVTVKISGVNVD